MSQCHLFKRGDLDEVLVDVLVFRSSDPIDNFLLKVVVPHLHVETYLILLRRIGVDVDGADGRFVVQQTERLVKVLIGRGNCCDCLVVASVCVNVNSEISIFR